jgi:hypothetical protein
LRRDELDIFNLQNDQRMIISDCIASQPRRPSR